MTKNISHFMFFFLKGLNVESFLYTLPLKKNFIKNASNVVSSGVEEIPADRICAT